ncbi:MAG: hypothetical protein GWN18_15830, partial [Thermoplasmata archaeon]|nr:hypothetical protein [Thermoplasmata archaeon]NIS21408.1 hypothetical protein [Thermoplasmata archaeon]NIT78959.1 hypothetical protein [Thermoplasmata archaeon]NIU50461.1 hypothetical protein [Thermoplasmata archaeon]NIW83990.1 hypothetical protein [Thermoplasmata archaeon]
MRYDRRYWAMFAVLLMVGAVLAASGCLDGNDDDDDELVIPGDRTGDSLEISGNVNKSMSITIEGMVEMGLVDFQATFVNSVGTTYTANYTGVLLKDILEAAIPDDGVDVVWLTASDGYRAMLFYADVDDDMYIALMEEDEWNDLSDAGTFRLVDTDLPSVYWVRDIVAITPTVSAPIWSGGYTEKQALINVGWIQERATEEVSWQEGEKTRTYTGVPMSVVLDAIGA